MNKQESISIYQEIEMRFQQLFITLQRKTER